MTSPLSGIKVVELTTMITGPLAGMMLADLGAEVVKIENPDGGDTFRSFRGGLYSPHFCGYNRNKRSLTLDLRSDLGRRALEKLIARSDVLLINFRPGVLDRLGYPDERLHALNAGLIRCYITGFGATGPYAERPAYDAVSQALAGMSSLFVSPDDPRIAGPTIADNVTGYHACYGIMAALFERERTGAARRIDVNMLESTIAFMPDPFGYYTQMNLVSDPYLRPHTSQSYAFRCADGKLITIHLSSQAKFWEDFVATIGRPDMLEHPAMKTRVQRIDNFDLVHEMAAQEFIKHPRSYWLEAFAKVDVPFAPVYDVTEVFDDPQVRHLDTFFALDHPEMGKLTAIRRPVRFDGSRSDQPAVAAPTLGEHTAEILRELGLSEGEAAVSSG
jgi:crotonobetainyl-CoA:carnitine CoA-transferase CaiB-like acyl-CoA transferase